MFRTLLPAALGLGSLAGCGNDYGIVDNPDTIIENVTVNPDPDDPYTEVVRQPQEVKNLDVLVVLDTSGSMSDDYERISNGMLQLQSDIDFLVDDSRFGFINSDPSNVALVGPYDSSQTIDIMMAPSLLPQEDSVEAGFGSSYTFYQNYTDRSEFLRDDASWLIFFVSDEEEQSSIPASVYHDWLLTLKPEGEHDVVAITTVPPDTSDTYCNSTSWGCKYAELVRDYYHKEPIDLTSENWDSWLASASFLTSITTERQLTHTPIPETILVKRDDTETSEWTYDSASNTVTFLFTPEYGEIDTITYDFLTDTGDTGTP